MSLAVALVGVGGTLAGVGLSQVGHAIAESQRRKREESARFHGDRRKVYAEFLAHLNIRRKYASDMSIYWDTPHFAVVREEAPDEGAWLRDAQQLLAEIHLLGDKDVISAATGLLMTTMALPLIMFAPSAPKPSREQVRERATNGEKLYKDSYKSCLTAMRVSLNIPVVDDLYAV